MNYKKLTFYLYLISAMIILIPIFIVLFFEIAFSSIFSTTIISFSFFLIIVAKVITILNKKNEKLSLDKDIGVTIGLALALLFFILKI